MSNKYTEIFKLKEMLEQHDIPFVFKNRSFDNGEWGIWEDYQICYPNDCYVTRVCSVIEGEGSYGNAQNKLEIMGLLTASELLDDSVKGWLTAEDVFERIYAHWARRTNNGT